MVICETSGQAKKLFEFFNTINIDGKSPLKTALILHDVDDKETRKSYITGFKKNMTVDVLIVYNMLLTGFDAPRLKRLYFCRKLKDHTLLQALTRVNRPYKQHKYGYVVDFADIKQNFEETNEEYLRELSKFDNLTENGTNSISTFAQIIEDKQTIIDKLHEVKEVLFHYTTDNLEAFCGEISNIENKDDLLQLKRALEEAKDFYNIVRTFGDDELITLCHLSCKSIPPAIIFSSSSLNFRKLNSIYCIASLIVTLVSSACSNDSFILILLILSLISFINGLKFWISNCLNNPFNSSSPKVLTIL